MLSVTAVPKGSKQANAAAKAALKGVSHIGPLLCCHLFFDYELVLTSSYTDSCPQAAQGANQHLLPPAQDFGLVPSAKISAQVDSSPAPSGRAQGRRSPTKHRERHEKDGGEQYPCIHCRCQGQQGPD